MWKFKMLCQYYWILQWLPRVHVFMLQLLMGKWRKKGQHICNTIHCNVRYYYLLAHLVHMSQSKFLFRDLSFYFIIIHYYHDKMIARDGFITKSIDGSLSQQVTNFKTFSKLTASLLLSKNKIPLASKSLKIISFWSCARQHFCQ